MRVFINFFLRVFAFFSAVTVFVILLAFAMQISNNSPKDSEFEFVSGEINSQNKIGLLKLRGPIINEALIIPDISLISQVNFIHVDEVKRTLKAFEEENIKGLIVSIDSPGGTVSATHNLYESINNYKLKNNVPIYFHTNELLASGAYWIALAGDKIFANYGSIIGSIGVQGPEWIYYDEPMSISNGIFGKSIETKEGIKKFNNFAGESKDLFDSFRTPTIKEKNSLEMIVNNIYKDFVLLVSKKRKIEIDYIIQDIGALIFDSHTAEKKYLIDEITISKTVEKKLAKKINVKNYQVIKKKENNENLIEKIISLNFKKNLNFYNIQNIEVCNILENYLNVIYVKKNC